VTERSTAAADIATTTAGSRDLVVLTGADLTIAEVEAVARAGARIALDDAARGRMAEARAVIERLAAEGAVVTP
jgi:histidine ammonia-lyase